MSRFLDMTIEELKDYISSASDNPIDVEEAEELEDVVDDLPKEDKKTKIRAIPFPKYFGEMHLTKDQIQARTELALLLKEVLATVNALIALQAERHYFDQLSIIGELSGEYQRAASRFINDSDADWLSEYSVHYATDYVGAYTRHSNDEWYTSDDRATFNAENEANTILNRSEFTQAKSRGFYHKQWITMKDKSVRPTHKEVDDRIIPIDDFFQVGDAQMLYPKDVENAYDHPEEIAGCRCSIRYIA